MIKSLTLFSLLLLLFNFSACEQETTHYLQSEFTNNTYTGIFYRTLDGQSLDTSSVTLIFNNNIYEGSSTNDTYPAIGRGSFILKNNMIIFQDKSFWLANFEWTYILDESFMIDRDNDKLILTKHIGNSIVDTYVLEEGIGE